MRVFSSMAVLVLAVAASLSAQAPATAGRGQNSLFLAPKATTPAGWIAPNKPWTRLPELVAKHANETDDRDDRQR